MSDLLKLVNISKYYHSDNNVSLGLNKINLSFNLGEFVAITGESGSGKSTLLNVIAGLDSYEDGELYFKGNETSHFDANDWEDYRKNNISFIFQNYNLIDSYTALENVMSVLFIQGYKKKDAKEKALKLLAQVGLSERIKNRATQLSSGQKQRLAIARALAKDTDIIVADEPTGNLDVENGNAILQILSELSANKLVLLVTHNYEQAEPYVTRKIRLADGMVKSDNTVNERKNEIVEEPKSETAKVNRFVTASTFAGYNIKNQPKRVISILSLMFFTTFCALSSAMIFESNKDIDNAKDYSDEAFRNGDKTRLATLNSDGTSFTYEEIDTVKSASKYINEVDIYGMANDFNFYSEEGTDYYTSVTTNSAGNEVESLAFSKDYTKFVKSVSCLSDSSLAYGNLPSGNNECVIYSKDKNLVGTTKKVYFANTDIGGSINNASYYGIDVTITGLLKSETTQYYFSENICRSLAASVFSNVNITYGYTYTNIGADNPNYFKRIGSHLIINNELTGHHIRLSQKQMDTYYKLIDPDQTYFLFDNYDTGVEENVTCTLESTGHYGTNEYIEVSEELFTELYGDSASSQASVFMKDYAYTSRVISSLSRKGFKAVSIYKVSTTTWNETKLITHYITLGVASIVFIVISILEIIITKALLKFKKNDFIILRSLGMGDKTVHLCNYVELMIYSIISLLASYLVINILSWCNISYFVGLVKYISFGNVIFFICYTIIISLLMGLTFNKFLSKQMAKVTSLKEDL